MAQSIAVGSRQIKAARALLDWSQDDLASASGLSVATIRKLELGFISPRQTTTQVIHQTFDEAGLEFLSPDGVRRRPEDVFTFVGVEAVRIFLDDLSQTVLGTGGEILVAATWKAMTQTYHCKEYAPVRALIREKAYPSVKCLMTEEGDWVISHLGLSFDLSQSNMSIPFRSGFTVTNTRS